MLQFLLVIIELNDQTCYANASHATSSNSENHLVSYGPPVSALVAMRKVSVDSLF